MGRPRLSIEQKLVAGTFRKGREEKRSKKDEEAKIRKGGYLYPSSSFSKVERDTFNELAGLLENNPTVGAADSLVLQNLARLLVELRAMEKILKKKTHVYIFTNREGQEVPKRRPESILRQELINDTLRLFQEFGLSPKSRGDHRNLAVKTAPEFDMFPGDKGKSQ